MSYLSRQTIRIAVVAAVGLGMGCDDSPTKPDNHKPSTPSDPFPAQGSSAATGTLWLRWTGHDVDGDALAYNVFFGADSVPTIVDSNLSVAEYAVDSLDVGQTYYWRVTARDPAGRTAESPLWQFSVAEPFVYPVAVGNRWEYEAMSYYFNIEPDSIKEAFSDTIRGTITVEITGLDTLPYTGEVYTFHSVSSDLTECEEDGYYRVETDGLYKTGSSAPCGYLAMPKSRSTLYYGYRGQMFADIAELMAFVEGTAVAKTGGGIGLSPADDHCKAILYPLEVGAQWTYGEPPYTLWRIDRIVSDWLRVETGAGAFDCFGLEWIYDYDNDGEWDESPEVLSYISANGLVKWTGTAHNVSLHSYVSSTPCGTASITSEITLSSVHVE